MKPSNLTYNWSQICSKLTSNDISKMLYRFVIGFKELSHLSGGKTNDSCHLFLKNNVAYDILGGKKLSISENLSFSRSLDTLHSKLIDLNKNSNLALMDLSLSINSYAKLYHNLTSRRNNLYEFTQISVNQIKGNILELLDIAINNIQYMNHHDMSMVLNSISKTNIKYDKFFNSVNKVLYNSLQEYYRLNGSNKESDLSDNLIKNITPLSVSLLLNSFSKSDVELNWNLLNFFVKEYVPKNINKFEINQLILSLNSFKKFNVPYNSIKRIINESDNKLRDNISEYTPKLISTSLYTFAAYNHNPKFSMGNVISYLMSDDLTNCSELELCNIYYAMSKINIRHLNIIEKLNEIVLPKLKFYTIQGVVSIFHSLCRLDYKILFIKRNQEFQCLEDIFFDLFSKLLKGDLSSLSYYKGVHNLPVPIHPTNICFGSSINLNLDPRIYNYFLNKLVSMLKNEKNKEYDKEKKINSIVLKYREELLDEDQKFKILCNNFGYKGMNQLYCILIHILLYVKGGLESIDYSILTAVNSMMDKFTSKYDNSKKNVVLEDEDEHREYSDKEYKCEERDEDEYYLKDENKDFSKIQRDVYKTVCKIFKIDENKKTHIKNKKNLKPGIEETPTIIYQEHIVTPYSVDIALFKL